MTAKHKTSPARTTGAQQAPTWFDKFSSMKKDIFCILVLLVVVYIFFFKIITQNMMFSDSGDTAAAQSWGKAVEHIRETENVDALWIPYIFSGMPIAGALIFPRELNYAEWLIQLPGRPLFLNAELSWFVLHYFMMGLFMYLLARQLKFSHLPSLFAAIALMLSPYAIGLAPQGHGSKLVTLSYIPLVFLLTCMLFERRNVLSLGLLSAATGAMLLSGHPQIAFYGLMIVGCYMCYEVILDIKRKPAAMGVNVLLLVIALGIGYAIYMYEFLPTQEYQQYSIRGGLTYDYATNWSFHPLETLTYVLPSFFGFSTGYVADWQGTERALPMYWGWMPFTEGPVYAGILPIILAAFALIYKRNRLTWFFALFSVLVFFISFGKYLGIIYNLMFNYMPYFNKFRAPSMILYLVPLTVGILAAAGMGFLLELPQKAKELNTEKLRKRLLMIIGVLGGLLLLGFVAKSGLYGFLAGFMFVKEGDVQQFGQRGLQLMMEKRFEIFWADYIKMTLLAGAALGLVVLVIKRTISQTMMGFGFVVLLLVDLVAVDVKFIDPKPRAAMEEKFLPDATVNFMESDSSLYRIFPLGQDLFQDNTFMYHAVSSIGGYSPAKLQIYQDLLESCLYHGPDPQFPLNMNVVNMLNAKYLVAQGRLPEGKFSLVNVDQAKGMLTYANPGYLPRAWFVDTAVILEAKKEIVARMNDPSWNPRTVAILEKRPAVAFSAPDSSSVTFSQMESRRMTLKTYTGRQSLLVLSEVFYPAGWTASVDGVETDIYKTNYVLRSVVVPAGAHTVEFRFDPPAYQLGLTTTKVAWGVALLLVVVGLIQAPAVRKRLGLKEKIVQPPVSEVPVPPAP